MINYEVASRYALALFNFAGSKEKQETILKDLKEIFELFFEVPEFELLLYLPSVNKQEKMKMAKWSCTMTRMKHYGTRN